jgi:hypothetical protein
MKIFLKYILILAAFSAIGVACRDEDAVRFPELQQGVNARVAVHPENVVLNFLDIDNANLVFDIYSINKNISEVTYSVTFSDAEFPDQEFPTVEIKKVPGSAFSGGKASNITISAIELAEAIGLPGGASYLSGGDNFTFFTSVKLSDGRVMDASNSAPSISEGNNPSFTTTFKLYVSCPFKIAEAIGTYSIKTDPGEWATSSGHQIEVVEGANPNQVILKDALGYPQKFDMVIDVSEAGLATVEKQKIFDYNFWVPNSYGVGSGAGEGFFFSCSGLITLNLTLTVDAGSFGGYPFEFQKN